MPLAVRSFVAVVATALGACAVDVEEEDVFAPESAAATRFTILTPAGDRVIDRNQARPGLFEEMGVAAVDGRMDAGGLTVAVRLVRRRENGPLFVFCGGTNFDIAHHGAVAAWKFAKHGDVLLWDYPGYGASGGAASARGVLAAARAVAAASGEARRSPDQPIVFWGHSLGGFACAEMAASRGDAAAVVFEATAPSAQAAAPFLSPWFVRPLVRVRLDDRLRGHDLVRTLAKAPSLPAIVLAGGRDDILPASLSRQLRDGLAQTGRFVGYHEFADAGHFDIGFQRDYKDVVSTLLADARDWARPFPSNAQGAPP